MTVFRKPIAVYLFALSVLFVLGVVYMPLQRAVLPFLWLFLTLAGAGFRGDELARFGAVLPKAKAWLWSLALAAIIFPPFVVGYFIVWGKGEVIAPPSVVAKIFAVQLVWVAIPEELFFRGYMQTRLYDRYEGGIDVLGVRVGWAIVITSALFAAGHLVTKPHILRLFVFFPSLIFGWLRERTGSVFCSALFHALCNTLTGALEWHG